MNLHIGDFLGSVNRFWDAFYEFICAYISTRGLVRAERSFAANLSFLSCNARQYLFRHFVQNKVVFKPAARTVTQRYKSNCTTTNSTATRGALFKLEMPRLWDEILPWCLDISTLALPKFSVSTPLSQFFQTHLPVWRSCRHMSWFCWKYYFLGRHFAPNWHSFRILNVSDRYHPRPFYMPKEKREEGRRKDVLCIIILRNIFTDNNK